MGRVLKRILCPVHNEESASYVLYADGTGHCYGCGHRGVWDESKMGTGELQPDDSRSEDLQESLSRIEALPITPVRGFGLPTDGPSYYILWPTKDYYKRRFFDADKGSKYRCPVGHRKPLYLANGVLATNVLVVVEGELNALSLSVAFPTTPFQIVSPGSASEFTRSDYLAKFMEYETVIIIVDNDKAGVSGGIQLDAALTLAGKDTRLITLETDFNQVLCEQGKDALRDYAIRKMEL